MTADLVARLRAEIDRRETAARDMAKMWPGDWELSDRGWMAKVTADGPVFREVMRIAQEDVPDDVGPDLGDLLRHLELNDPNDTIRRCAADREIVDLHTPERGLADGTMRCRTCHGESWILNEGEDSDGTLYEQAEWHGERHPCATLRALVRRYGLTLDAPAAED